jgi:DNA-binding transcriptional LysR family regulator
MRLRQIEVFHAVYSTGSMTSAAAMLNVSQPSVSKVLAHAEQQLGYLLFERLKGKLVPTPEAHRLFAHVSAVYRDVDRLRRYARVRAGSTAPGRRVFSGETRRHGIRDRNIAPRPDARGTARVPH